MKGGWKGQSREDIWEIVLVTFVLMRENKGNKDSTGIASVEKSSGYFPAIIVRAVANSLIVTN